MKGNIAVVQENLTKEIEKVVGDVDFTLDFEPRMQFGDLSTNVALVVSQKSEKEEGESPRDVAEKIKSAIALANHDFVADVSVAGPGFVNITLTDGFYNGLLQTDLTAVEATNQKKILVEYTNPNPFKAFHVGHLMSNTIGEAFSRLLEAVGAKVTRVNYQGDVGLHVAKTIWGMQQAPHLLPADGDSLNKKIEFLDNAYVNGADQYENDPEIKTEIDQINVALYRNQSEELKNLYQSGRAWSLEKFSELYQKLGTSFDKYFFESEVHKRGHKIVNDNVGTVFKESDGAIVFAGEEQGLHTRVYVTGRGLPTYEAKDLGLHYEKQASFDFDESVVITGSEQTAVFQVGHAALGQLDPEGAKKLIHKTHGLMVTADGKVSSRKGSGVTAERLLNQIEAKVVEKMEENNDSATAGQIAVAAIKFQILRQTPGKNITFDLDRALSFEGDSGPYLQYTAVRAASVVAKAATKNIEPSQWTEGRNEVTRLLGQFESTVHAAAGNYAPQTLCTYLLHLSSAFNSYYAQETFIDTDNPAVSAGRLALAEQVSQVIKTGLDYLGIKTPDRM